VTGALRAAWGLTVFVILLGAVMWAVTGRAVFAAFIVLGLLTGVGAWLTGRTGATSPGDRAGRPASKEDTTP
jgi:hypothetical protein